MGWDDLQATEGGGNLALSSTSSGGNGENDCSTCGDVVLIDNQACVINNLSSTANTGNNSVSGGEATIETGNAYSLVSLINFVNTSIIRSFGFLGFINIFGFLNGDVGGASLFAAQDEPAVETTSEPEESGPDVRQEGGLLEISLSHNVGTHVLPGDTITFFVTVKNPGTGRVYDAKVRLGLIKDGFDMGGGTFDLGDIDAGKGFKLTTGLVLSQDSPPGEYLSQAIATGYVGPADQLISASAESPFLIVAANPFPLGSEMTKEVQAAPAGEALGAVAPPTGMTQEQKLWLLLFGTSAAYLSTKGYQRRRELAGVLTAGRGFIGSRSAAFRSFLVSLASFLT